MLIKTVDLRAARAEPVHQGLAREQEPMRPRAPAVWVPAWALTALLVAAAPARAQTSPPAAPGAAPGRPSEADIFGAAPPSDSPAAPPGPPATEPSPTPAAAAASPGSVEDPRDRAALGVVGGGEPAHLSDYQAPDNPLQIGGNIYLRAQSTAFQGVAPDKWTLSAPSLVDLYLDARPNPRVRAFVLGRMSYDATAAPAASSPSGVAGVGTSGGQGAFVGGSATGFTTFNTSRGPNSLLDQLWVRFDVGQRLFLTVGKQHVRWGTGRFWQPTDYLHQLKRNPLDVFDARAGTSMIKLHFPWEERAWNFYAFAIADDPSGATNSLRKVAGAARAELVILGAELGLDVFVRDGQRPRFGVDLSTGLGDFDVYADVGIRWGEDFRTATHVDPATLPVTPCTTPDGTPGAVDPLSQHYGVAPLTGIKTQAVGGLNYARKYNDNDVFVLGAEYFYNQPGYSDTSLYPGLLFNNQNAPMLNFFYIGRHYGALFASLPAPYSWNRTTFTASTLANLSDLSAVSRIDIAHTVLTHLSLEMFVGVHYGSRGGEFRLGFDIPTQYALKQPAANDPATGLPICDPIFRTQSPLLLDLGVALRMRI